MSIKLFPAAGPTVTTIFLSFRPKNSITYSITYCSSSTYIENVPTEIDKIWKITKTSTSLIITCNDVEVVNMVYADSTEDYCITKMGRSVKKIYFFDTDTASDHNLSHTGNLVNNLEINYIKFKLKLT